MKRKLGLSGLLLLGVTACQGGWWGHEPPKPQPNPVVQPVAPTHPFQRIPLPEDKPALERISANEILQRLMPLIMAQTLQLPLTTENRQQLLRELSRLHEQADAVEDIRHPVLLWQNAEGRLLHLTPVLANTAFPFPYIPVHGVASLKALSSHTDHIRIAMLQIPLHGSPWQQLITQLRKPAAKSNERQKLQHRLEHMLEPNQPDAATQARLAVDVAGWFSKQQLDMAALTLLQQAEEATYRIATLENQHEEPVKSLTEDILQLQTLLRQRAPKPFDGMGEAVRSLLGANKS